jgi:hypothetical protein
VGVFQIGNRRKPEASAKLCRINYFRVASIRLFSRLTLFAQPVPKYYSVFSTDFRRCPCMPTLYFCQPHAKNQGMLRAVLSIKECERVVSQHPATYVGQQFPKVADGQQAASDFAVLNFPANETPAGWQPGYYRLDSDLTKLNESLLALSR